MSAGSDNWADAPLVVYNTYQAETPSPALTLEPFEVADADMLGYYRSAWWKFVVPVGYGGVNPIRLDVTGSYFTAPGDGEGWTNLYIYKGESPDTWSFFDSGDTADIFPTPGDVFYLQVVQWKGMPEPNGMRYVLGVGEVTHSYTDWEQGPNVTSTSDVVPYINSDHRSQRIGGAAPGSPPSTGPFGTATEAANTAFDALVDYNLEYLTTGGGTPTGYGGTIIDIAGTTSDSGATWRGSANMDDVGIYFNAYSASSVSSLISSYRFTLTGPEGTVGSAELEASGNEAFPVVSIAGAIPLSYADTNSGANSLYVRWSARPADSSTDVTSAAGSVDERLWSGNGTMSLPFEVVTGGKPGVALYPETLPLSTPDWVIPATMPSAGDRYDVVIDPDAPNISITATLHPPRHRWVIEHYLDPQPTASPAPPLRLFPRDDGLGFSSSARIFPQPSSEQGSNRIGGYW